MLLGSCNVATIDMFDTLNRIETACCHWVESWDWLDLSSQTALYWFRWAARPVDNGQPQVIHDIEFMEPYFTAAYKFTMTQRRWVGLKTSVVCCDSGSFHSISKVDLARLSRTPCLGELVYSRYSISWFGYLNGVIRGVTEVPEIWRNGKWWFTL